MHRFLFIGILVVSFSTFQNLYAQPTGCNPGNPVITSATGEMLLCNGDDDGNIDLTVSGGTAPYSYFWSHGEGTMQDPSGLSAGTYTVTVTDAANCAVTASAQITQPASKPSATVTKTDVSCFGVCDGTAFASPFGGTVSGPYGFLWDVGATTQGVSGLCPGIHGVTIYDDNGCFTGVPVVIPFPSNLITSFSITQPLCFGDANAIIDLTIQGGGTPPYTYLWSTGATTQDVSGLTAGSYMLTITDNNGCIFNRFPNVGQPPLLSSSASGQTLACAEDMNGMITLAPTGGTPPYSFLWSNSSTAQNPSGLGIGTYTVTITDNNACQTTRSANITGPAAVLDASISSPTAPGGTNISCIGGSDGSATASATGGTSPYTFLWSTGSTNATINNLGAGSYSVTVTDNNGCTDQASVSLTEPSTPVGLSLDSPTSSGGTNVSCTNGNDGSATATPTGGSPPYAFIWSNGQTGSTATGLSAMTYFVTVSDQNGCSETSSVTLDEPAQSIGLSTSSPVSNGGTNISCQGGMDGSALVTASGGTPPYTYLWSNGQSTSTATGLSAGNYFVTVFDQNNCFLSGTVSLSEPPEAVGLSVSSPTANGGTNVSCQGGSDGSATASASGGILPYTYNWSNGQTEATATGLSAGTYTVTVSDVNGCSETGSVSLNEPSSSVALMLSSPTFTGGTNVSCSGANDGSATVMASGGTPPYNYLWSNSQTNSTATGLMAGTYTVTVTDLNSCQETGSIMLTEPPGNIALMVSSPTYSGGTNVTCAGADDGSATVSSTGGTPPYDYLWSNGQTTATAAGLMAGLHTVTVSDQNGCSETTSITLTEPPGNIMLTLTSPENNLGYNLDCSTDFDASASVSATGGSPPYTYLWSNGQTTATTTGLGLGIHTVTVTDLNGCAEFEMIDITSPPPLDIDLNSPTFNGGFNVGCQGGENGSITSSVSGGNPPYTYQWNTGASTQNLTGLDAGTYTLSITDNKFCMASTSITLTQPATKPSAMVSTTDVSCFGTCDGTAFASPFGGTVSGAYGFLWDTGATTQGIVGLCPGIHGVTILDDNGCFTGVPVFIPFPPNLISNFTQTPVSCNGGSDGAISFNISGGGTPPYSFLWSNGSTMQSPSGLMAGNYTVTVTDANTCTFIRSTNVSEPTDVTASATGEVLTCLGDSDGNISLSVSGGIEPYTFLWNNGAGTMQNPGGLSAGTYTVTVTDNNNCTETASAVISPPSSPLLLSASSPAAPGGTNIDCTGDSSGQATANASQGTAPYTYAWSNGLTTATATGLAAGPYSVTVTDSNGCLESASVTLTEPAGPINLILDSPISNGGTNIGCYGESTGEASVSAFEGTPPYTYLWSNGQTTSTATGLTAGSHTISVTDFNGCLEMSSIILTEPGGPIGLMIDSPVFQGGTNIDCKGESSGEIILDIVQGTSPYDVIWSNGATDLTVTGLIAGTYSVTVTDFNGCQETGDITITEPAEGINLMLDSPVSNGGTNIACNGESTGEATAIVSEGTPPYSFEWSNGQTDATATGLTAGLYTFTVTDLNGCSLTDEITLNEPAGPIDLQIDSPTSNGGTNIACQGDFSGEATAIVNQGTAPYTYSWSNGQSSSTITGLAAGTYTLTITDLNGCSESGSITLDEPAGPIDLMINSPTSNGGTNIGCAGESTGEATISVNEGTAPYSFAWSNGQTNATATGLAAGSYNVTVTDFNGCSDTGTITLDEPAGPIDLMIDSPTSNGGTNIGCAGESTGEATISVNEGTAPYTFAWSNGQTNATATGLAAGSYNVTVTDFNGCSDTGTITLDEPAGPIDLMIDSPTSNGGTNIGCAGESTGEATVSVNEGTAPYTFAWSDGQINATATGLAAGTYTVTVTDLNGCSDTGTITLDEPAGPIDLMINSPTSNGGTNIGCAGESSGEATVSVNEGTAPYTFAWSDGQINATATGLAAGTYTVTVTDLNGCSDTGTITLDEPAGPIDLMINSPTSNGGTNIGCAGESSGEATVSVNEGTAPYTFAWSNGQTNATATGLAAGSYSVTVTDFNGCSDTGTITLNEPVGPIDLMINSPTSNGGTNIACQGEATGEATVSVNEGTAPYTFAWSNGQTNATATGLAAGSYSVTVTDFNGCSDTGTITLDEPAGPIDLMIDSPTSNGGTNIGCGGESTGEATVSVNEGTAPYTYSWSDGQTNATATSLAAGSYTITVTDFNGCSDTGTITLDEPAGPIDLMINSPTSNGGTNIACQGEATGEATVSVNEGTAPYTYSWSDGQTNATATGLAAGTYAITVTDFNGCSDTGTVTLDEPSGPIGLTIDSPTSNGGTNIACQGEATGEATAVVIEGSPPYTFQWSTGETTPVITGLAAGSYNLTVTDVNGCEETAAVILDEPSGPIGLTIDSPTSNGGTNIACQGEATGEATATVIEGTPPYTYQWDSGQTTSTITGLAAGTYTITITDFNGCSETGAVTLDEPSGPIGLTIDSPTSNGGTNIACQGETTGEATAVVIEGTPPYTYQWDTGQTTSTISGLAAGTYTITVTDFNGCSEIGALTLDEPSGPIGLTIDSPTSNGGTNIACQGETSGEATAVVIEGTPPYTYQWDTGQTTATITGLGAGSYSITVTDFNGCSKTGTITLDEPSGPIGLTIDSPTTGGGTNIDCRGEASGEATAVVIEGTPPYTYLWSNGETNVTTTGLIAGTYSITVTDFNGCSQTASIDLTEPQEGMDVDVSSENVSCAGSSDGSVDIEVFGGSLPYSFDWSNGATTEDLLDISGGTYNLTITDVNGCTVTVESTVIENDPVEADLFSPLKPNGYNISTWQGSDGEIDLTIPGGAPPYDIIWSNGSTNEDLSGLSAGTYSVTVTDTNGCMDEASITIEHPNDLAMPTGISPNGDDQNDTFVITGIDQVPNNTLTVVNRWGNLVFETKNYQNDWAGDNMNGEPLPDGTYFVLFDVDNGQIVLKGFVDIRR